MAYEILIPEKVERIIDKRLDKNLKERLYKKLLKLEENPQGYSKPLRFPLAGVWEIYFEKSWRVLFEIHNNEKKIVVIGFKHKNEMENLT